MATRRSSTSPNIESESRSFTVKQMVSIASFIGTVIVTISFGVYFILSTKDTVSDLEKFRQNDEAKLDVVANTVNTLAGKMDAVLLLLQTRSQTPNTRKGVRK